MVCVTRGLLSYNNLPMKDKSAKENKVVLINMLELDNH